MIDNEKSNERNGSSRFSRFGGEESKDEENCFPFFENGGHVATLENYATVSLSLSLGQRDSSYSYARLWPLDAAIN